jgi:hypothetical protein
MAEIFGPAVALCVNLAPAKEQRKHSSTEFIIFGTMRARFLYEIGETDKREKAKWHQEFLKMAEQIKNPAENVRELGQVEVARHQILCRRGLAAEALRSFVPP